jgi:hypothetical protein
MQRAFPIIAVLLLSACAAGTQPGEPSLSPRAAERIDPRLPVPDTSVELPASADLQAQLSRLLGQAQNAQGSADAGIAQAEAAAARAGPRQSEGWIAAQQLLSAAIAARYPVTRALGDIDALVARSVQQNGGLVPADLANVQQAAEAAVAIDRRQAERIDAVQARLR